MTTLTADAALSMTARPLARRLSTIMLLQLTNPLTLIGWPLSILTFILLVNLAIIGIVRTATDGGAEVSVNGGIGFIWVYTLVMAVQSVNQTFPLALGFGATRRDYLLGTGALFTALSIGYALLVSTMAMVERATNYWGVGLAFFDTARDATWFEVFFGTLLILLLFASVGAATASVYVRWKAMGMYVFWGGLVIGLVVAAYLIAVTESWGAVGEFFATAGLLGTIMWSFVITVISAIAAYLILRRATPTNT